MITDTQLILSDEQAVTGTDISENVYDTGPLASGNSGIILGSGTTLYAFVLLTETMDDTGDDSTVTVTFETSAAAGLTSATTHLTFDVFAATTAAGAVRYLPLPPTGSYLQYAGFRYTVANGDLSAGKFTAGITLEVPQWHINADGRNFA